MPNMDPKKCPMPSQEPNVRNKNFKEVALGYTEEMAINEAKRCLQCKNHPCRSGCPVEIDIPGFIKHVAEGDFEAAYNVIAQSSALPAVCGRVCPQEHQCEGKCVRGIKGEAVGIGRLERFVADWYRNNVHTKPAAPAPNGHKVAVIGAGPSGLTVAGDLAKLGYKVTVYEALHVAGGVLMYGIPEFRLPKDIVQHEVEGLKELGVDIETNMVIGKVLTIDELMNDYGFEAVYVASGAGLPRFMGIPGESLNGVYSANEFLTRVNLMKAYKEDSRTPIMKSKSVAVVGGGNVAIDAARVALRCGSSDVTMVCLEPREKMPASAEEIAEAEEEGTAIRCGYGPKEFLTKDGHVCGVVLKRCTGLYDAEGRFAPTYDESVTITLPCDNVVLSIGQCIQWGNLLDGEAVQLGRGQGAVADVMTYQTAQSDIFVGGDVYTGPRFAIDAIAAGKQGAISIHRFVQPNTSLTIGRNRRDFYELDKTNLALGDYDRAPRQAAGMDDAIDAHRSFRDAHLTLTEAQVKTETARCLGCGASVVDPNKCIGCGVCTTKCEFDAIHLHRDLPECSTMVRSEDKFKAILPYMAKREVKIRFGKKDK